MKNQIKKISLFTAVVLTGVLLTFTSTANAASIVTTNDVIIQVIDLSSVTPDGGDILASKCGTETESKTATKESKCGEGKCGDDKSKESKTSATTTAKNTKTTDAGKCGEGKCGDDKSNESKTTTTSESKKKTSEGKCGEGKCGEGKCGTD